MDCWLCNAKLVAPEPFLTATIFHFWARCCTACKEKYGEKDERGRLIQKSEGKHE